MKVNDRLFYKMRDEQEAYLKRVSLFSSDEVIALAEEIALRNLILDTMERHDLSFKAAFALINNPNPLSLVYEYYVSNNLTFEMDIQKQMEKCGCWYYEGHKAFFNELTNAFLNNS